MNAPLRTVLYFAVFVALTLAENETIVKSELPVSSSMSPLAATPGKPASNITTTKVAPVHTTTSKPETTTNIPTTTSTPEPVVQEGKWAVQEGNLTCIRVQLKAKFVVHIEDKKYDIALSPLAKSAGDCNASSTTQVLALSYENYILVFEFENNSSRTFVKNITFTLSTFEGTDTFYNDTGLFDVTYGKSYMCRSTEDILMGNVTMQILDIHLQSFGAEGNKDFGDAEECEADDTISNIVPIAVACALAALIVVVLIAYLVGRRRNRQKGYTSV